MSGLGKTTGAYWLDVPIGPVGHIAFVPDKKAWKKVLKYLKWQQDVSYPTSAGCCTILHEGKAGSSSVKAILITLEDVEGQDPLATVGLLAHECMHVVQYILEAMNEDEPGSEVEAYMLQQILQQSLQGYLLTRGKLSLRKPKK